MWLPGPPPPEIQTRGDQWRRKRSGRARVAALAAVNPGPGTHQAI